MKPQSARALMWSAAILIILGMAIGAPAGAVFLFALAALCAGLGLCFGVTWVRVVSAVLLLIALGFGAVFFHAFRKEADLLRRRAAERDRTQAPAEPPAAAPVPGEPDKKGAP